MNYCLLLIFGFLLLLANYPYDRYKGLERLVATFIIMYLIGYMVTKNIQETILFASLFTIVVTLIDKRGCFSDVEFFTEEEDTSNVKEEDIDTMTKEEKKKKNKTVKEYTPEEAQQETYRMIDTVKQLTETMEAMQPVLSQGGKLLALHKKLGGELDKFK